MIPVKCERLKSLGCLHLILILLIDILIYLKVLKNTWSSIKLNTGEDNAEKTNGKYWKSSYFIL